MRLCGGTFFTLLTTVKREATRRKARFMGEEVAVSETAMLVALLKILNPEHRTYAGDLKTIVSRYKACKYGCGMHIPLDDPRYTDAFQRRLRSEYPAILRNMKEFCEDFLDTEDRGKMEWLCGALRMVIASDPFINGDDFAYVNPDGRAIPLRKVPEMERICLPTLLTGIWGYIVMRVPDNAVGRETIQEWTKDKEFKNGWNAVSREVGGKQEKKIEVTLEIPQQVQLQEELQLELQQEKPQKQELLQEEPPQEPQEKLQQGPAGAPAVFSGQGLAAFPALELSALDKGLYSLFVMEGEVFPGGGFTMPMDRSISTYIDPAIRREFLPMTAMEIARLTRMPALFATPNHAWNTTEEDHQIILGRVTGVLLQKQGVRFDWKPYCFFPQERLNEHEELFDLCCSEANNELSEEHWTIKRAPLLSILRSLGLDPWERMNPVRMVG